jgi:hypothetical protein
MSTSLRYFDTAFRKGLLKRYERRPELVAEKFALVGDCGQTIGLRVARVAIVVVLLRLIDRP